MNGGRPDMVAVVGLGRMGEPLARRLMGSGREVVVWNRTASRTTAVRAAGARVASTPREAAEGASVVITMVADPAALRAVTAGPDGVGAGMRAGAVLAEMSTVGVSAIEELRALLAPSVGLVDTPVYGSTAQVEAGELHVFAGGTERDVAAVRPVLAEVGQVVHVGPLGSGAAAKLVANTALMGVTAVLGEALALAESLGLPLESAFDILGPTPLGPQAARRRGDIEGDRYPTGLPLRLAVKDLDLVLAATTRGSLPMAMTSGAHRLFESASAAGWSEHDYTAVLGHLLGRDRSEPSG